MYWRKGTVLTAIWGGAFAISMVFLLILLAYLNGWTLDLAVPRQGFPVAILLLMGIAFDTIYFFYNRHRHFLFVQKEYRFVTSSVKKKLREKRVDLEEASGTFARVPWMDETALVLSNGEARIYIVEKAAGTDVVLEADDPAPYKRMILNALS